MKDAAYWLNTLQLSPHPEGGCYRRTYQSAERLGAASLPARFSGDRFIATAILYLLEGSQFSALHRIKSDEIWHFYAGSALRLTVLSPGGKLSELLLGSDPEAGHSFQQIVEAGSWFGAEVSDPLSYSLVGCTVAPGFDFEDFELADRGALITTFPEHRNVIERLTRIQR